MACICLMAFGWFCIQFNFEDPRISAVANMATSRGKKYSGINLCPRVSTNQLKFLKRYSHGKYCCSQQLCLFPIHQTRDPDDEQLQRNKKYSIAEYREALVRQLAVLKDYEPPPVYQTPVNHLESMKLLIR